MKLNLKYLVAKAAEMRAEAEARAEAARPALYAVVGEERWIKEPTRPPVVTMYCLNMVE